MTRVFSATEEEGGGRKPWTTGYHRIWSQISTVRSRSRSQYRVDCATEQQHPFDITIQFLSTTALVCLVSFSSQLPENKSGVRKTKGFRWPEQLERKNLSPRRTWENKANLNVNCAESERLLPSLWGWVVLLFFFFCFLCSADGVELDRSGSDRKMLDGERPGKSNGRGSLMPMLDLNNECLIMFKSN